MGAKWKKRRAKRERNDGGGRKEVEEGSEVQEEVEKADYNERHGRKEEENCRENGEQKNRLRIMSENVEGKE